MLRRIVGLAASLVALGIVAGCQEEPQERPRPPAGFSASVLQYTHDAVVDRIAVKVANGSERPFTVEELGLRAPGFAPLGPFDYGTEVPPGRAFDLRMTYGEPDCDEQASARRLSVEVTFAGRAGPVVVPVEDGAELMKRIHDERCAVETARAAVPLSWGEEWSTRGEGDELTAVGTLRAGPVADGQEVRLAGFNPTTLFQLSLRNPPAALASGESAEVTVHLRPSRCDAHALGESPQGFEFLLRVGLAGSDVEALVPVLPNEQAKKLLTDYWVERCGLRDAG